MKKLGIFAVGLLTSFAISAQVGIGTLTPNSKSLLELNSSTKGLLLPRMSATDRANMSLSASDAGMMVYQTVSPKGIYLWDGATWIFSAPVENGGANGHTLRWDGTKWTSVSNLFNQGTSIGIGTQNPNTQLQINSINSPTTRLQFTNSFTGSLSADGFLVGIALSNGSAHLIQQENRSLSFGTNAVERMRIDSVGRVGINTTNPNSALQVHGDGETPGQLLITNTTTAASASDGLLLGANDNGIALVNQQENRSLIISTNGLERIRVDSIGRVGINTSTPTATLEVNGTFKLGNGGSPLQSIVRMDYECDPPEIAAFAEWYCNIPCPGTLTDAIVYVSPGENMDHIMVGYARVNVAGNVQVKLMNMSTNPINIGSTMLHVAIIQ
ncbi:MAG TPA: hypothetical protein VFV79_11310 [Saprospiraceae bacterium]|nr:hypothetical protein [Saprospiraceae bacterium]